LKHRHNPRQFEISTFTEPVGASKGRVDVLCQQRGLFVHGRNLVLDGCLWRIGQFLPMHDGDKQQHE
jgi:hypothetical protein